jgi:outer membrane protein OmpA-like peptidoglycan-associated protein
MSRNSNQIILFALLLAITSFGCAKSLNKASQGALTGAALGAGTGAIIGNQTGNAGAGVAIGAGLGAVGGAIMGNAMDRMDQENQALETQINRNQQQLEENRRLIDELRRRGADVRSTKRGVVINLPDILFEFDRYALTGEARRTIGEISGVLRDVKNRSISVEGHTDSIGTVRYNKQLSLNRASSVKRELVKRGIPGGQMAVRGYGEGAPIATNNTEMGRSRNRRVEIIIEN